MSKDWQAIEPCITVHSWKCQRLCRHDHATCSRIWGGQTNLRRDEVTTRAAGITFTCEATDFFK